MNQDTTKININDLIQRMSALRKRIDILQIKLNAFNQSLDYIASEDNLLESIK